MIKLYSSLIRAFLLLPMVLLLCGCQAEEKSDPGAENEKNMQENIQTVTEGIQSSVEDYPASGAVTVMPEEAVTAAPLSLINSTGMTLETRINPPEGYTRIPSEEGEFTGFVRSLRLKEDGSEVLLYDGSPKSYQDGHVAVFELDTGSKDLQQCADSIIRIYAEYYWSIEAYDKIDFHLTNGFLMEYTKWRDGYRIEVDGNEVSWVKKADYDASYEVFRKYLESVFMYAGTLSLSAECSEITIQELLTGDMLLYGGSPGHCVLVVDMAEDAQGNKCYLLAQGYMPAQDFHILKNPLHEEDPWYYASEITYPLRTPQWTFEDGSLVRWDGLNY